MGINYIPIIPSNNIYCVWIRQHSPRNLLTSHGEKTSLEELERCFEALVGDSAINRASLQGMGMENYGKVARSQVGDGSIPIHTIFGGMNICLPAILGFTRGTRF